MHGVDDVPLVGRQRQARRNDVRIQEAAREVFGANPAASMADVGRAAGVGMGALYRRFGSKDELIEVLLEEAHLAYAAGISEAMARLSRGEDAWTVFADYLRSIVDSPAHGNRPGAASFAGALERARPRWGHLVGENHTLFDRVREAGAFRDGLEFVDIGVLLNAVGAVRGATPERSRMLRRRVLEMCLEGMRAGAPALPGAGATAEDYLAP